MSCKEGKILGDKFLVSITTQRELETEELTQITQWLDLFDMKAYFVVDQDSPDIKLPEKSRTAIHEIKQYISNKFQDHISQVYNQKTQGEKSI